MLKLNQIPLVRLILPFICGIVVSTETSLNLTWEWLLIICIITGIVIIILNFINISYFFRWIHGLIISIVFFIFGFAITESYSDKNYSDYFANKYRNDTTYILCKIIEEPVVKTKTVTIQGEVVGVCSKYKIEKTRGKLLVHIEKDTLASVLEYGDIIIFKAELKNFSPPLYKGAFDYGKKMFYQDIHHYCWLKRNSWTKLPYQDYSIIKKYSLKIRKEIRKILQKSSLERNELAMASALLLGMRSELDTETIETFANIGIIHILAVSGMHVGLIYGILFILLKFLDKIKNGVVARMIIILIVLWIFASITGFSPSVLRATIMFTFVAIGNLLNKYINNYNVLAAAAFTILIMDPFSLYNPGFILSFTAVLGIFLFYKPLYYLIETKYFLIDKIWQMASVSIAAQIFTTPVSLYFFHQFPVVFLLSNILILPLISFLMYSIVAIVLLFPLAMYLSELFSFIASFLIQIIFSLANFIQNIPYATVFNIKFDLFQVIVLYVIILTFYFMFALKNKTLLWINLISIIVLFSYNLYDKIYQFNTNKIEAFGYRDKKTFVIKQGNSAIFLLFGKNRNELEAVKELNNYITENRILKKSFLVVDSLFFRLNDDKYQNYKKGLLIETDTRRIYISEILDTSMCFDDYDYVIVSNKIKASDILNKNINGKSKIVIMNYVNNIEKKDEILSYIKKNDNIKIIDIQRFNEPI